MTQKYFFIFCSYSILFCDVQRPRNLPMHFLCNVITWIGEAPKFMFHTPFNKLKVMSLCLCVCWCVCTCEETKCMLTASSCVRLRVVAQIWGQM